MIDDSVLTGRIPRLGTITTGRGTEATTRAGKSYARPVGAKTLVMHTNDPAVATAAQTAFGGTILADSPTWEHDLVTDVREIAVDVLVAGFRQTLEVWRAAECVRRCDGVTMSTRDGRPTGEGCVCAVEMAAGAERACKPSTILPVLIPLDVERFGVWEVKSNAWGTAASMKGAMRAISLAGSGSGSVPAVLTMVDRTVRDAAGKVHEVSELHLTIARSHASLAAGHDHPALPVPDDPVDDVRAGLLTSWADLQQQAHRAGLRDRLAEDWRARGWAGRDIADLSDDDFADWLIHVDAVVADVSGPQDDDDRLPGIVGSDGPSGP